MPTWGPAHLGGGVYQGKPPNLIPDECVVEAGNMEFSQMAPRTREDFEVEDASGPGTPPYQAFARFEAVNGSIYRVLVDSLGDIYAKKEPLAVWLQINAFKGKGQISSIAAKVVTLCDIVTDINNPEKWGYGIGIMAQAGDGFKRDDDTVYEEINTSSDTTITLVDNWVGPGTDPTYKIRRRLTIQADKKVVLYPEKNILWITDQVGRPLFWDGVTFGELACFCKPRDDVEDSNFSEAVGVLPDGKKFCYRFAFISASGALCPPCPELTDGGEYFSHTMSAPNKSIVLTKKVYLQGFPSWVKEVAVFRTLADGDTVTRYRCSRSLFKYTKCKWSCRQTGGFLLKKIAAHSVFYCRQLSTDSCPDRVDMPDPQFFFVDTFAVDIGGGVVDNVPDADIQENELWADYGLRKHPTGYAPGGWVDLPTYINAAQWFLSFKARLFTVSGDEPNELRYSGRPPEFSNTGGADEFGWWFQQNARVAGRDDAQEIRAGFELRGDLYVAKDSTIMRLETESADPANWILVPVSDQAGAICQEAVLAGTLRAYLLGRVQGQTRLFAFDGNSAREASDQLRETLDEVDVTAAADRAKVDRAFWKSFGILHMKAGANSRQLVIDISRGSWTVWDAPATRFLKGVPHADYLLCVKEGEGAKTHRFLSGTGRISSWVKTKQYPITAPHIWKVFTGAWFEVSSKSGLEQVDDVAELNFAVYTGGEAWGLIPQDDGTHVPANERKTLWRPFPHKMSGDFIQVKAEINSLAKDFTLHRVIFLYDPAPGRRVK